MLYRVIALLLVGILASAGVVRAQAAVYGDLAYVEDGVAAQRLDVYLPGGSAPYPTLLLVHGGGFAGGDKSSLAPFARYFAARGYAVVSINYRLTPDYVYPAQVNDTFCALAWVYANAATYGFDTSGIAAVGESAGGYLAAMLGTVDDPTAFSGECPNPVSGGVRGAAVYYPITGASGGGYPVSTQAIMSAFVQAQVGQTDLMAAAWAGISPLRWVNGNEPPFLLIHGTGDDVVPANDSVQLAEALRAAGTRADLLVLPDADHGFMSQLETPEGAQAAEAVAAFLRSL